MLCIGAFFLGIANTACAFHGAHRLEHMGVRKIDQEEGWKRIEDFRNQRLKGDYSFKFELRHMPRKGKKQSYSGILWGTWNQQGPLMRVALWPENPQEEPLRLIVQGGEHPQFWKSIEGAPFEALTGKAIFEPLLPGLMYTPFDLLNPYAYWEDMHYEGSKRIKGRPAHLFLMSPPAELTQINPELGPVRMALDAHFNAILQADWLSTEGVETRTLKILNLKKTQGEWIIKTIDLVDEASHDKTRFNVKAAALGLKLDPREYFTPKKTPVQAPAIDWNAYERI